MNDKERKERVARLLNRRRIELSQQRGVTVGAGDFARWLGISGSSLSQYTSKNQVPTGDNFVKLADRLGADFFVAMGLAVEPPQDPMIRYVIEHWCAVDNNTRLRIVEIIEGDAGNPAPAIA